MDTKLKLELLGLGVTVAGTLYLIGKSRQSSSGNAPSNSPIQIPPTILPGGITYGGANYGIPALAANPALTLTLNTGGPSQPCSCGSCGCDANNPANQFAASISQSLNSYAQGLYGAEKSYQSSVYGEIPNYISQYITTADPTARGGLNG